MIVRNSLITAAACIALVAAVLGTPAMPQTQAQPGAGQPDQAGMAEMMKMHQQMMAEMKAGEAKLDGLVRDMNAATGQAKTDAVAAVVNELVRQHKGMHQRMGDMHGHMMNMMGGRGMARRP